MKIEQLIADSDWMLTVVAEDGRSGRFDVKPYLEFEAFRPLRDVQEFRNVFNGGYFVEWACGADLSADTIEARWNQVVLEENARAA